MGSNEEGELGIDEPTVKTNEFKKVKLSRIYKLISGPHHTFAMVKGTIEESSLQYSNECNNQGDNGEEEVWSWGLGADYQLGFNTRESLWSPRKLFTSLKETSEAGVICGKVLEIAAGGGHSVAIIEQ